MVIRDMQENSNFTDIATCGNKQILDFLIRLKIIIEWFFKLLSYYTMNHLSNLWQILGSTNHNNMSSIILYKICCNLLQDFN